MEQCFMVKGYSEFSHRRRILNTYYIIISHTNNLDEKAGECHTIRSTVPTEFPSTIEKNSIDLEKGTW